MSADLDRWSEPSFTRASTRLALLALVLGNALLWGAVLSPNHAGLLPPRWHAGLRLDFINVGQGDAILVRTPEGRAYLIDGGEAAMPEKARIEGRELVQEYLPRLGVTRLDGAVVTHPHNDHLGGVVRLLRQGFPIDRLWESGVRFNTPQTQAYGAIADQRRIPRIRVTAGDTLDWGAGVHVQVLAPEKISGGETVEELNDLSLVLFLRYGAFRCLLPGDLETKGQKWLLGYGDDLRCQVMKVPHHGSAAALHRPLLDLSKPQYAILHVGAHNSFGYPHEETVAAYLNLGTKLLRTDRDGTVRVTVGGETAHDFTVTPLDRRSSP